MVFLEGYEHVGDMELSLELRVALQEFHVAPLGLGETRLAARLLRCQAGSAVRTELGTP